MNILIADKMPAKWVDLLKTNHQVTYNAALDENTLPGAIGGSDIVIVRSTKVNAAAINAGAALKLIIRAGAGVDNIDVPAATAKNIAVCNCPGTNSIAVAELAMGLMLALDRRIYDNVADFRAGVWNKSEYSKAKGIYGSTLGIIGLGNIGREVNKRAAAFGMNVIGFDPFFSDEGFKTNNIKKVTDIYELAAQADVISVHMPDTKDTKGLFNKKFFDAMKPGAVFINTSRGALVVQEDLIDAVNNKKIRAGLDVYANEPKADAKEFNDPITQAAGIYGTHHIGASTEQAQEAVSELAVKIVDTFAANGTFLHRVNKK